MSRSQACESPDRICLMRVRSASDDMLQPTPEDPARSHCTGITLPWCNWHVIVAEFVRTQFSAPQALLNSHEFSYTNDFEAVRENSVPLLGDRPRLWPAGHVEFLWSWSLFEFAIAPPKFLGGRGGKVALAFG